MGFLSRVGYINMSLPLSDSKNVKTTTRKTTSIVCSPSRPWLNHRLATHDCLDTCNDLKRKYYLKLAYTETTVINEINIQLLNKCNKRDRLFLSIKIDLERRRRHLVFDEVKFQRMKGQLNGNSTNC